MEYFEKEILTVEELMEYLYIGKNTAYHLLNAGKIKGFRIGRGWRIPFKAIEEYVYSRSGIDPDWFGR